VEPRPGLEPGTCRLRMRYFGSISFGFSKTHSLLIGVIRAQSSAKLATDFATDFFRRPLPLLHTSGYGTAQSAHRTKNSIRLHNSEVLEKVGLRAEKLFKELARSMRAERTLFFSNHGMVIDTRVVPDHPIQLRGVIELAKMYGLYPSNNKRKCDHCWNDCSAL
jgi:hypothetical protein